MTRTQTQTQTQRTTAMPPTPMDNPLSPGSSTGFGTNKPRDRDPLSPLSPGRDYNSQLPSPPPVGRAYTHTPRSTSEPLAHLTSISAGVGGLTRISRPRDEIRDLTEQERLRVEWDILLRKKDKYKTWKKRTKDEWRELENAKVLMEANRQRLREDETIIGSEKHTIGEERTKLNDEMRIFRALQKDVETQKMELEEQRMRLADDRQVLIEDLEKFHQEKEEYEEERRKHAEETVVMRREWEEMKDKYDAEMSRMNEARHAFDVDMVRYERERRIYEAIRHAVEQNPPPSSLDLVHETQSTPQFSAQHI